MGRHYIFFQPDRAGAVARKIEGPYAASYASERKEALERSGKYKYGQLFIGERAVGRGRR